jgi:hypothetical protein
MDEGGAAAQATSLLQAFGAWLATASRVLQLPFQRALHVIMTLASRQPPQHNQVGLRWRWLRCRRWRCRAAPGGPLRRKLRCQQAPAEARAACSSAQACTAARVYVPLLLLLAQGAAMEVDQGAGAGVGGAAQPPEPAQPPAPPAQPPQPAQQHGHEQVGMRWCWHVRWCRRMRWYCTAVRRPAYPSAAGCPAGPG